MDSAVASLPGLCAADSFKLGKGLPSSLPAKRHSRSHSRSSSVSSSLSSFSFPAPSNVLPSVSQPQLQPQPDLPPLPNPSTKRNSHHRRRSSVSTRRESAELMGVSLPDLPPSVSEDNINLGEKDSIRRRALWALEGKPDMPFSKVEIPELSAPAIEKIMFDFATKPSLPSGSGSSFGNAPTPLMGGKRDSFKLLASSGASKDQLGTLVEEEEEEDEQDETISLTAPQSCLPSPAAPPVTDIPITPSVAVTRPTPTRPRPATLNLRPLSLVTVQGLPTPSLTPSPRSSLRSLSLSPGDEPASATAASPSPGCRRPSLNNYLERSESPSSDDHKPVRRSSISYKSSHSSTTSLAGLPTPEMTPTFSRYSGSESATTSPSEDDTFFPSPPTTQFTRPLSASEQHFLFKSHNALLARITDLERALSMRRLSSGGFSSASRRDSMASTTKSDISDPDSNFSGPDDEMLRLIADLKSERDELKRDVDGWRMRVGDMEKQLGIVTKRVEAERRDAWVARSRVGLLEVEKGALEKRLQILDRTIQDLEGEKKIWELEKDALVNESAQKQVKVNQLEAELAKVKLELEAERMTRKQKEAQANVPSSLSHPLMSIARKRVPVFASVDSSSSTTDVDSDSPDTSFTGFSFPLKAVVEDVDEDDEYLDDDNGLASYEDEDEEDVSFGSSSSFGSADEMLPRSNSHLQRQPSAPTPSVFAPVPPQSPKAELSKTWTFPRITPSNVSTETEDDNVDRFFGCLEDLDSANIEGDSVPISPSTYSYEKSKSLFSSGFKYASQDDDALFFGSGNMLPEADSDNRLPTLEEEDEEEEEESEDNDDNMFGQVGGITITFTPPDEEEESDQSMPQIMITPAKKPDLPPVLPAFNFGEEEDEDEDATPFSFGRPLPDVSSSSAPSTPPPSSIPRPASPKASTRSSIPRMSGSVFSSSERSSPAAKSSSPSSFSVPKNEYVTPPTRRGGVMPSFIPQPVSSPSPMRVSTASKPQPVPTSTFIRKPLVATGNNRVQNVTSFSNVNSASSHSFTSTEMKSIDLTHSDNDVFTEQKHEHPLTQTTSSPSPANALTSIMASPFGARLQTLTNFIPRSWAPVSSSTHSVATPRGFVSDNDKPVDCHSTTMSISSSKASADTGKPRYVSREKQLERLRDRLRREGEEAMRDNVGIHCRNCDDCPVTL